MVSWGELLWDLFPHRSLLGGTAANVAYHGAILGAESWLVSAVGDDSLGRQATEKLEAAGVTTDGVTIDRTAATGRVRVTFVDGNPRFSIEEGVAWDKICPSQEVIDAIVSADVFSFSTLAQRTPLMRSRLKGLLLELRSFRRVPPFGGSRGEHPLCVLDLNLRPPFTDPDAILETIALSDVVKVNEEEADWVAERAGAQHPAHWLLENFPVRLVAITRGERGASLYTRHASCHAPGLPIRGGDPVGAGDAFVAALSVALAEGAALPRALEIANRHGAWVAGSSGAMPHV